MPRRSESDADQPAEGERIKDVIRAHPPDESRLPELRELRASQLVEFLDGIPGAFERAERGFEEIRRGEGISLSDL